MYSSLDIIVLQIQQGRDLEAYHSNGVPSDLQNKFN